MDALLQRHLDLAWDWWTEMGVPGSRGVPVGTTLHPEARTLRRAGGPAWTSHHAGTPIEGAYPPLGRPLDLGRPSLALLRLRAALGVHARSEVLPALTALRQALITGRSDIERSVNVQRMLDHHADNLGRLELPPLPNARGRDLAGAVADWLLEVSPVVWSGVGLVA